MFNIQEFLAAFSTLHCTVRERILHGKSAYSVLSLCVPTLHRMCIESRVFYPTISQRSCHVQHSTLSQNTAEQSVFNIQEFQTAFSTLHCTVRQRILNGKSGYSMHTVCSYIAQNLL